MDQERLYLSTSPEFGLKKTLPLYDKKEKGIFEISSSFRKERTGKFHQLEFTMLEWYERSCPYLELVERIDDLIFRLREHLLRGKAVADTKSNSIRIEELFSLFAGSKIQPDSEAKHYEEIALSLGINKIDENSMKALDRHIKKFDFYRDEWLKSMYFQLIFDNCLLPNFRKGIWHVHDFPPFLRGMATLGQKGWAERVECFYDGIEISSGYQELFSIAELEALWEYNDQIRRLENKIPHKADKLLIQTTPAMEGVCGVAIGIERLLMAMFGLTDIREFFAPFWG